MASIREEYRKFRVKSELGRKQREAEIRQVSAESIAEKQRRISGQSAAADKEQVQALEDELQRLRNELADKEEVRDRQRDRERGRRGERRERGKDAESAVASNGGRRCRVCRLHQLATIRRNELFYSRGGCRHERFSAVLWRAAW